MRHLTVLATGRIPGGTAPFTNGELTIKFQESISDPESVAFEGPLWILVDWLLPDCSGLELCKHFRMNPLTRDAHIAMLLDQDDEEDKRRAVKAGANDYTTRPPSREQLIERFLRSGGSEISRNPSLVAGPLHVDLDAYRAQCRGKQLWLAPNQFRLLCLFMSNQGQVLTRDQIIAGLRGPGHEVDPQTVSVWVKRLRLSLKEAGADGYLRTIKHMGYVLDAQPQ